MKATLEVLLENKKDYTRHLCELLTEPIYVEINSIYQDTVKKSPSDKILELFQDNLANIPKWNADQVTALKDRIYIRMDCNYFQELVKTTFMVYLKLYMMSSDITTPIKVKVPSMDIFIHRCLVASARYVWKKPYLLYHKVRSIEKQQNLLQVEKIIQKSIIQAIQRSLPLQDIFDHASQNNVVNGTILHNNIDSDNENNTSESEVSESENDSESEDESASETDSETSSIDIDEDQHNEKTVVDHSLSDEDTQESDDGSDDDSVSENNGQGIHAHTTTNEIIQPVVILSHAPAGIDILKNNLSSETESVESSEEQIYSQDEISHSESSSDSDSVLNDDEPFNLVRADHEETHVMNSMEPSQPEGVADIKELVIHEKKHSHHKSSKDSDMEQSIAIVEKHAQPELRVPSPSPHLNPGDLQNMQRSLFNRDMKHINRPKSFHLKPKKVTTDNAFF